MSGNRASAVQREAARLINMTGSMIELNSSLGLVRLVWWWVGVTGKPHNDVRWWSDTFHWARMYSLFCGYTWSSPAHWIVFIHSISSCTQTSGCDLTASRSFFLEFSVDIWTELSVECRSLSQEKTHEIVLENWDEQVGFQISRSEKILLHFVKINVVKFNTDWCWSSIVIFATRC